MSEDEIMQIVPAPWGWYAYGQDGQGVEFLAPVALWALVESSSNVRRVVGLGAHGLGSVSRVEDLGGLSSTVTSLMRAAREREAHRRRRREEAH